MNRNPIPIVLPCHRVVGSTGKLVGYGGGLERKEQLLRLEGALLDVSTLSLYDVRGLGHCYRCASCCPSWPCA